MAAGSNRLGEPVSVPLEGSFLSSRASLELLEHAKDLVFTHDLNGRFSYVNRMAAEVTGYSRGELLHLSLADIAAPEFRENAEKIVAGQFDGSLGQWWVPVEIVRKSGRRALLEISAHVVCSGENSIAVHGIARDLTPTRQAEIALRQSESRFRALSETANWAVFIYQGPRVVHVNRAGEILSGYPREELLRMNFWELVHPDHRDLLHQRSLLRPTEDQMPGKYHLKVRTKGGEDKWVHFGTSVIPWDEGLAVLGTALESARDRHGEEDLHLRKAHLEQLFESAPEGIIIHDQQGRVLQSNREFNRMFGYETGEIQGQVLDRLIAPPDRQDEAGALSRYVACGGKFGIETVRRRKDGTLIDVSVMGTPVQYEDGQPAGYVIYRDISDRRRTEQALLENEAKFRSMADTIRRSELRYRSLFERAEYGIYRSTPDGRLVDANPALVRMLGYDSSRELMRVDFSHVYIDPEEHDRLLQEIHAHGRILQEAQWRRRDGKPINVRINAIATHRNGEPDGLEVIVEDVTERRALEEQLRHSQKMEAIGRLAGGVAHDFNNLLTVIKGYSEMILQETGESDPIRSQLDEIRTAADRAASLTRQLLAFSRRQMLAPKVLDLNVVVSNMENMLRRLLGEDMELHTRLDPELGRVKADPGQLEQVIMNLAVNARDAMPTGGRLIIETANATLDESYRLQHATVVPGEYVMLAVTDNGHGMPEPVRSRIFEPFFTTKERGTGLGLSTAYGIVKQSGGYVWVYSEVGKGTTFKVYLPLAGEELEHDPERPASTALYRGTETVLVVEDEDGVRDLVSRLLQRFGYKVLETRSGAEALQLCEHHPAPIHLLLTDVVLSKISGPEVAVRLVGLRPQMRVLYMSGYTEDTIVQHGVLKPGIRFLQKPFTTDQLLHKVREVLDAPPGASAMD